jgi:hypothetical protein
MAGSAWPRRCSRSKDRRVSFAVRSILRATWTSCVGLIRSEPGAASWTSCASVQSSPWNRAIAVRQDIPDRTGWAATIFISNFTTCRHPGQRLKACGQHCKPQQGSRHDGPPICRHREPSFICFISALDVLRRLAWTPERSPGGGASRRPSWPNTMPDRDVAWKPAQAGGPGILLAPDLPDPRGRCASLSARVNKGFSSRACKPALIYACYLRGGPAPLLASGSIPPNSRQAPQPPL